MKESNCYRPRNSSELFWGFTCHCQDIPDPLLALAHHIKNVALQEFQFIGLEEHREFSVGRRLDIAEELRAASAG